MVRMTNNYSDPLIPQYDVYKVSSKKIEQKVPFGGVKVNIFAVQGQEVGSILGFLWVLVL
jgi:hypothetical protein